MKTLVVLGALAAAAGLAACTEYFQPGPQPGPVAAAAPGYAVPASAGGACFYTRDIRNHTIGGDHTLYFDVNGRDVYRVEMSGNCLAGATSSDPLIIRNTAGTTTICHPLDLDIGVSLGGMANHCIVSSINRLTPAEIAALPPKIRP